LDTNAENQRLRMRVAELEHTVNSCLELVNYGL
jgi:hypothetical protein